MESETYDIYLLPPGEDLETCTSWLRMRNRDGRYNLMFEEWVTDGPFIISPRITFEVQAITQPLLLLFELLHNVNSLWQYAHGHPHSACMFAGPLLSGCLC